MKIQSLPTFVYAFLFSVSMVKMIRPAFVMTPMVDEISKMVCHVPRGESRDVEKRFGKKEVSLSVVDTYRIKFIHMKGTLVRIRYA